MAENINCGDIYMINPKYTIRSDKKRALITNAKGVSSVSIRDNSISTGFAWILHPLLAVMLSYFDGTTNLKKTLKAVAEDFHLEESEVMELVEEILNMKDKGVITFKRWSMNFSVPKNFLIKKREEDESHHFDVKSYVVDKKDWDLVSKRLYIPNSIALMTNNNCYTDCIYCYANKDYIPKKHLSLDRIKKIIQEASDIGVTDLTINGGDFFLYKYWKEVLEEILKFKYSPYLSTKFPISKEEVDFLKKMKLNHLQISFDSDDPQQLQQILNVKPGYHEKMLNTFRLLEEAGINVDVKAVISKYNCEIDDARRLIERIKQYKNIRFLSFAPGEASLYKKFEDYRADLNKLKDMENYVNSFGGRITPTLEVNFQGYSTDAAFKDSVDVKKKRFKERATCSGNFTALFILPDGQVGICEQLYWHPNFIIGDLNEQSIMEVWNSDKAKKLFEFPKSNFPETSPCNNCESFDFCRYVKGVCWKNIFFAYGMEKIYNPDPDCPYAPKPTNIYYQKLN